MTILLAPADADNFRLTKDWGRWYFDPYPTDNIAPATEDVWPSYSRVKASAEGDWSFMAPMRFAALDPAELHRIADLDHTFRLKAFRDHHDHAKQTAYGRGTIVHLWAEDLARGGEPREITDAWLQAKKYPAAARTEAEQYRAAIIDFFQVYQPEPVALEYVTIHRTLNGHGYGATPDGLFTIEGDLAALDWKTRGAESQHTVYEAEPPQIACGVHAEYMIVGDGDGAMRQLIPKVDVGYVVSIKPDGARLYPIDIPKAWDHFQHWHQWWVHRLDERASIKRILPARRTQQIAAPTPSPVVEQPAGVAAEDTATPAPIESGAAPAVTTAGKESPAPDSPSFADQRKALLARHAALTPAQKRQFKERNLHPAQLEDIAALLDELENPPSVREMAALADLIGGSPRAKAPAPPTPPAEGPDVDEATWAPVVAAANALPAAAKTWCGRLFTESRDAGVTFHRASAPTLRRYELYRGLVAFAKWGVDTADGWDDTLLALVYAASGGDDATQFANVTPGHALGSLDADEAATFAQLVDRLVAGDIGLTVRPDGVMVVAA